MRNICSIAECEIHVESHGYCKKHWRRVQKHNDPHKVLVYVQKTDDPVIWKLRFDQKWQANTGSGCWDWIGAYSKPFAKYSYQTGQFKMNGKKSRAHRCAWIFYRGQIPLGLYVLHKCNNSMCVNPDHLYLGTHEDNMRDMAVSCRAAQSKFTDDQVHEIRAHKQGCMKLAKLYGVAQSTIKRIRSGKTHYHISI